MGHKIVIFKMNRSFYYILITIAFGIISTPTILSILFHEPILLEHIDRAFIKLILIFFICLIETNFIKKTTFKILGWILLSILFIGIQYKMMHWHYGTEMVGISGALILINLTALAFIEKNKNILNYLLFVFVLQRLAIILTDPNLVLWWIDVIVCVSVTLLGTIYAYASIKAREEK